MKVLNAQAAQASGVIIFNEGNPGRTDVLNGSLVDAAGNPIIPTIPVAFTSFDIGQTLYKPVPAGGAEQHGAAGHEPGHQGDRQAEHR